MLLLMRLRCLSGHFDKVRYSQHYTYVELMFCLSNFLNYVFLFYVINLIIIFDFVYVPYHWIATIQDCTVIFCCSINDSFMYLHISVLIIINVQ